MRNYNQQVYIGDQAIFQAIRNFVSANNRKPSIIILNPTDLRLFVKNVKKEIPNIDPQKPYTYQNIEIIESSDLKKLEIRVY